MKKIIAAAGCVAILGSVSVASAQATGPQGQQTLKQNDPMDANARMKKKMKKGMMKQDGMSGGMNSGMSGGGMSNQSGMSKQGGMSGGGMTK